jgi:hypothetical protein
LRNKELVKKLRNFSVFFYVFKTKDFIRETYKKVSVYSKNSCTKDKDSQTKEIFQRTSSFSHFLELRHNCRNLEKIYKIWKTRKQRTDLRTEMSYLEKKHSNNSSIQIKSRIWRHIKEVQLLCLKRRWLKLHKKFLF